MQYEEFVTRLLPKFTNPDTGAEPEPAPPTKVESMLVERIQSKFAQVRKAFRAIDKDHSGTISPDELALVLKEMGLDVQSAEVQGILKHMDKDQDGAIEYDEFNEQFGKLIHGDSMSHNMLDMMGSPEKRKVVARPDGASKTNLENAQKILKNKLANNFSQVRLAFRRFDEDHSGTISQAEFRLALRSFGVDLSDADLDAMVATFDQDGGGDVSYEEFNTFVSELLNPSEKGGGMLGTIEASASHQRGAQQARDTTVKASAEDVEKMLVEKIKNKFNKVQHAFRSFDKDHSGSINADEFKAVLYTYGLAASEEELERLVSKFDVDGDGTIRYDEFNATFGQVVNPGHDDGGHGSGARRDFPPPREDAPAVSGGAGDAAAAAPAPAPAEPATEHVEADVAVAAAAAAGPATDGEPAPPRGPVTPADLQRRTRTRKRGPRRLADIDPTPSPGPKPVRYGGTHRSKFGGVAPPLSPIRTARGMPTARSSYSSSRSPGKLSKTALRRQLDAAGDLSPETVAAVRKAVASNGGQIQSLFRAFRRVDTGRTGDIPVRDFIDVLQTVGVDADRSQLRALASAHAHDGRSVDYPDFVKHFARLTHVQMAPTVPATKLRATAQHGGATQKAGGGLPGLRPASATHSMIASLVNESKGPAQQVRGLVETSWKDMMRVFRTFDDDRTGRVSIGELRKVLAHFGVRIARGDLELLTAKSVDASGEVSYQAFIKRNLRAAAAKAAMYG